MAKATITKIDLQNGTDRTVYVTWKWSKSNTAEYDVRWYYATGDGVRFIGSEQKVTITNATPQSTYTAPENATLVKFQVKPIAKTRKVNNKDVAYWTAQWSTEAVYNFSNNPPTTPGVPTVEIKDYTLTAKLENLDSTAAEGLQIQFQVVKNDRVNSDNSVYKTGTVKAYTHQASYSTTVDAGGQYKVRCRAIRNKQYSSWSDFSSNQTTVPASPSIDQCYALTDTSIYISWKALGDADSYTIEYATKEEYLEGSNATTSVSDIKTTYYTLTGLESGQKYFLHVKATNTQGGSGWSDSTSIIIGKEPAAPTTWSSTTTAVVGEEVILYWTHNAEDGSKEHYAELELYINGVKDIVDIKNESADDEDENKISSYKISTTGYAAGATIQWRVRTAGITMAYGDYSIQRTINVYAPATLELHVTDNAGADIETLTSFPFYVKGIAGPSSQTPIGYYVSITANDAYETIDEVGNVKMINKGDEVYSHFYDTSEQLTLELSAGSIDLENNISYTVSCISTMDTGLSAQDGIDILVAWTDVIYEPDLEIGYDPDTLSVFLRPYCEDESGNLIEGVTLSVYRREYDGSFMEIGKGLINTNYTYVTDPHPSLDFARYRVVAVDDTTGAVSYSDIPGYPVGEKAVIIQWNEAWRSFDALGEDAQEDPAWSGSLLRLPYNIDVSDSNAADVTLVEYIGRRHPVSYYGTQVGASATWNMEIDKQDKETLYGLRRLAIWMGDVYVREPSGSGYWANVSVSFSQTHCELVIPVTLNITRVEGGI